MRAALRCRPSASRAIQPLTVLSRGTLVLNNGFSAHSAATIGAEILLYNPQDSKYYLSYHAVGGGLEQYGLAQANSPDGTWTDLGALPGITIYGNPHHLMLGPDNKWSFYCAHLSGTVQLWQTAAGAAINSTYTQTSSALIPLGGGGSFDAAGITEPFVFEDQDGTWRLLYMGVNSNPGVEQMGMATSSGDHTGPWTKVQTTPIIPVGAIYDSVTVADPFVVYYGGTYYIFYCAVPGTDNSGSNYAGQGCATTTDFSTFTKHGFVFPAGVAWAADCIDAWAGSMWWSGLVAGDNTYSLPTSVNTIYYHYYGRQTSNGNGASVLTQGYLAKIDAESIFVGGMANPWTREEFETSAKVARISGAWSVTADARGYSNNAVLDSDLITGSRVRVSWTGRRIRVYFREQESFGIANIVLDGVQVAMFDAVGGPTTEANAGITIGYDSGDLWQGEHTLDLIVSGTKNAQSSNYCVSLDCFECI